MDSLSSLLDALFLLPPIWCIDALLGLTAHPDARGIFGYRIPLMVAGASNYLLLWSRSESALAVLNLSLLRCFLPVSLVGS